MKTQITAQLSEKSLEQAKTLLSRYIEEYKQGINNSIKTATEAMYNKVLANCYNVGIQNSVSAIQWEYDETTHIGRVWVEGSGSDAGMVIIFNEMGTGMVGSNSQHEYANQYDWKYDVNKHGEAGWKYPKGDGTYGWTRGLPSRHMFFDAFNDIKDEIGEYIDIYMQKL